MINKYIKSLIVRSLSFIIVFIAILILNPILNKLNLSNFLIDILKYIIFFLLAHTTEKIILDEYPPPLIEYNKDLYKKELEAKNKEENKS